jgi:hypothetical protein
LIGGWEPLKWSLQMNGQKSGSVEIPVLRYARYQKIQPKAANIENINDSIQGRFSVRQNDMDAKSDVQSSQQ